VAYWSGTASLIVPGALALKGNYWAAGKGLSMVSPLLFMLLVAPIVASRCGGSWWRVPAILLVAGHVAFGLYRPVAAASPSGIHYASPRYPSGQVPQWKEDIRWNLQSWVPTLLSCERVSIDSDNYVVERYVQLLLEDLKLRSSSTLEITTQLGGGVTLGTPKQLPNPDCVITTMARSGREGARIIWLLKNVDVLEFLQGGRQSVELAVSRSGVVVRGASEVEVTPRGPLRWTTGDAHFILPNDPARPARRLMVGVWDVRAPRVGAMEVLVNGRSLFAGPLPEGEWAQAFSLEHVDSVAQLDVQIRSATGRFSGDPRPLGIALREVRVSR
jgi:hypothetical protein